MKRFSLTILLTLFVFVQINAQSSTSTGKGQFMVQVNENTIVKDSTGTRLPFPQVMKALSSGKFTLDPIKDKNGKSTGEYRLRPTRDTDAGKRETIVRTPGSEQLPKPEPGDTLPDFTLVDIKGDTISRADLANKIVVINFWFSICKPCIYEIPDINKLAAEYKENTDLVFLAPNWEKKYTVEKFLELQKFDYRVFAEANDFINKMKIRAYPTHLIIKRDGTIFSSYAGGMPGIEELLKKDIETVLKQ